MDFSLLRAQIAKVNKSFYDRVYADPWMGKVFAGVSQEHIENQQTDFMLGAFGGPKQYSGRTPADAHPHIFVDEQLWALREKFLVEAFIETSFPLDLRGKWIKIDEAFKASIIKASLADCHKRYATDEIIDYLADLKKRAS